MLQFKQSDTTATIILTLTENVTIPSPNYLFVFKHVLTKDVVAFVMTEDDDESNFATRYNQFTIDPAVLFAGHQPGEWQYAVHEQADSLNTNPDLSGDILEYGKLYLLRDTEFDYTKYDSETSFKTYNG